MRSIFSSRKKTGPVFLAALLALLIGGAAWWWFVARAAPAMLPAGSAAEKSLPDAEPTPSLLGIPLPRSADAPTEADPAPTRDGMSWGHRAGLHMAQDDLHLKASAAYVVDQGSGKALLRKNDEAVLPIASLTKLMTALVLTAAKLPMNESITVTDDDVDRERHSRSRLPVGSTLTRSDALRLALMSSENRAAHALARTFPGGLPAFVAAMNASARAQGLKSTRFVDPTGLSNLNQSTARDLAVLAAAASRNPLIREYSTTPQHELMLGQRSVHYNNSDRLVKSLRWDIQLQKTGYIVEAGDCLVVNATMAGRNIIVVLLDSTDARSRLADAERIRRWVEGEREAVVHNVSTRPNPGLRARIREPIGKLRRHHRRAGG
jgi:D-alanyl-D-alanine endopeptidase (penicillin-binding protein 7)